MKRPLNGSPTITQEFGSTAFDYTPYGLKGHHGVDYGIGAGTPVYAPESGVIEKSANGIVDKYTGRGAAGETITMVGNTMEHWLMHLQRRLVTAGQRVNEGDLIGYTDNTGVSTGNHLHWGTRPLNPDLNNGYRGFTNPADWLFKPAPTTTTPQPAPVIALQPTQRLLINTDGVNQREQPNATSRIVQAWPYEKDDNVYNFKGFVRGQDPYGKGNNIWFVGAKSGGYFYSGAFEGGANTTGLQDLSPKPPIPAPTEPPQPIKPPSYPSPTKDPLVTKVHNKKNPLGGEYVPSDLVDVGNGQKLRKEAAESLNMMSYDSANALVYGSGYRSYNTQSSLYDNYVKKDGQQAADRYSARPGYSEHQSGLVMDFSPIDDSFKNIPAWSWLNQNAYKYGWVLRYPDGKEPITGYMPEPWHWRYIGVAATTDMHNKSITTLEEYYNIEGGLYPQQATPTSKDDQQDAEIQGIKALLEKVVNFLSSIFRGFNK